MWRLCSVISLCGLWKARPKYRKNMGSIRGEVAASKSDIENSGSVSATRNKPEIPQLNTQKSLRHTLQEVKIVQVSADMELMTSLACELCCWCCS